MLALTRQTLGRREALEHAGSMLLRHRQLNDAVLGDGREALAPDRERDHAETRALLDLRQAQGRLAQLPERGHVVNLAGAAGSPCPACGPRCRRRAGSRWSWDASRSARRPAAARRTTRR